MASGHLVTLRSPEGQKLLAEAHSSGGGYSQHSLLKIFNKQLTEYTCGIASCSLVLSAPAVASGQVQVSQGADTSGIDN